MFLVREREIFFDCFFMLCAPAHQQHQHKQHQRKQTKKQKGFSAPADGGQGWLYSAALVDLLAEYRRRFGWLFSGLEKSMDSESRGLSMADLLPNAEPGERAAKVCGFF